ncbi:glycerophosphodiester phosphodiesterase family protein [Chitinophaga cymbidii]|uniref:Glycerophosphoryl diester phosphodiesterase n=1 Tax=Chitinophaga cymbidii TaxID=1096750 RepID=A0A512RSW3_9BACT|nr:glycerophosphodiester phosphodiesterase family protein [Chitinophaga cymbidii]GEP98790.1 glycerophosphoryl diester phosphodiesterase [Chitinophaga cymbidii]
MYKIIITICCIITLQPALAQQFDAQAHRGGRGMMPENTIAAMKYALDLGATLEMDLYFSKDNKIIVSHDAYISGIFARHPDGRPVLKSEEAGLKLNQLTYDEIRKFDVGLRPHPEFPQQKKMAAVIPLLAELIDSVEAYAAKKGVQPSYNIEAKVPSPASTATSEFREQFIKATMEIIRNKKIQSRVMIQSFDPGMLEIVHRDYAGEVKTSFLTARNDVETNLRRLTFVPDLYSPYYKLVTAEMVEACHQKGMKVLPWTVNTKEEINKLKSIGVDGIISDYPHLF